MPPADTGPSYPTPLAELIVTEAKTRNLSLTQVAKRAGWSSVNSVRYYTTGDWPRRPIPQQVQQQIADGLGVELYRVQEAVRLSLGEEDLLDDLSAPQKVVLAAMRKADEETEHFISEITLRISQFAERHAAIVRRSALLTTRRNDVDDESPKD